MTATVKHILSSTTAEHGITLHTLQLRYWRAIHAEFMTHRDFSRNAGSSRAIPVKKMLGQVWSDPAGPEYWGANQAGMQAAGELTGWRLAAAKLVWRLAAKSAAFFSWLEMKVGLHKQVANRITEPYQYINVLVSSTEWDNFFKLRDHPAAQPEFRTLARNIGNVLLKAEVQILQPQEWHMPFILPSEWSSFSVPELLKLSTARCARISYEPFDGDASPAKEFERHDKLLAEDPIHASPSEHQAKALLVPERVKNFRGWAQYRCYAEKRAVPFGYTPIRYTTDNQPA